MNLEDQADDKEAGRPDEVKADNADANSGTHPGTTEETAGNSESADDEGDEGDADESDDSDDGAGE